MILRHLPLPTWRALACIAALGALIAALGAPALAQAAAYPANDDFVRHEVVVANEAGLPDAATLTTATSEPGEPSHGPNGSGRSAWWSWTAPRSGVAEVASCSPAFTPLPGLYTGFDVARLAAVPATAAPGRCQLPSSYGHGVALRFDAVAGTAYRIATATDALVEGFASVAVQMRPSGDDFADAPPIPVDVEQEDLALGLATVEPGEPAHGGRTAVHSAWYAHTPARRERVHVDACSANYSAVAGTATIYRGDTLASLIEVASSRDGPRCGRNGTGGQVEALLDAGVPYRIAVTQDDPTAEPVTVRVQRSPPDDSAATPSKLRSGSTVDLALATREPGEPEHAGQVGGRSRWKVIAPDVSATYEISTCPSPYGFVPPPPDALLAVYEGAAGTTAGDLTPIASNDDGCPTAGGSLVRFRALAGRRYLVAIDSRDGVPGTVELTVRQSPPADDRDAAARFPGTAMGSFTTTLASAEPGEPAHAGEAASHSVWFRWVAPRTGNARVALCGASFDAVVAVYGVDPAEPPLASGGATPGCVGFAYGSVGTGPHFDVPVIAGRTYLVAVDGRGGATGTTGVLTMAMTNVINDDFLDAASMAGTFDEDSATFEASPASTPQPGEPAHAGRAAEHSVWWRWTATRTGFVTLSSCGTVSNAADSTLAVYRGDALSDLEPVAAADDGCGEAGGSGRAKLSFYAVEGEIYRIAADLHGTTSITSVRLSLPPSNDRLARAFDLTAHGYGSGSLTAATSEPGEPDHAGRSGGRSLWYAWTAARTAPVEISTCGYVDTVLGVYTGSTVDALEEIASDDDSNPYWCGDFGASLVRFVAQAGTTYRIAVDGKDGATGAVSLSVRTAPPADRFAAAAQLEPQRDGTSVDLRLTTAEPGEPAHGGRPAARSSWLRFTPERASVIEASVCSSGATDTVLAAYTGGDLQALTLVAQDDDAIGCEGDVTGARIRFEAAAGVTYFIAVDASSPIAVRLEVKLLTANDDLAEAADLALDPGTIADTLIGATREAGEPEHGAGETAVSAWYRVRVGSARSVRLSVCPEYHGQGSAEHLAVYTGDSIAALRPLDGAVASTCSNGTVAGRIVFPVEPGTDVLVAVAAPARSASVYELTVEEVPPNDLFAAATVLGDRGGGGLVPEAAHAATEPGEPLHAGRTGGHSLWWSYTPATDRTVRVHGCADEADPLLSVYTGDAVEALAPVAIGIQEGSPYYCANLSFSARAGVTYRVALDVDGGGPGPMRLSLSPELPVHTSFAAAAPVAIPSSTLDDLERPGPEPGEPVHGGLGRTRSVWYRLQPVRDEILDINSCGFNGTDTVVAVYTGAALDALTEVASDDDADRAMCTFGNRDAHVAVAVRSGTVYWVAVDDAGGAVNGRFELFVSRRAPHDDFADPFELVPGTPITAWTGRATAEPGEPAHDGLRAARSVWSAWTAPRSGRAVVDACGPNGGGAVHLAAYTGDSVDALTRVASDEDSPACPEASATGARVELDVVAGRRYHVAVDDRYDYTAPELTLHVAPPNDDRAAAAPLPAPGEGADVDLTAAGTQVDEPAHAGVRGGGSAWYEVTPAQPGGLQVDTCTTATFDTVLAVYRAAGAGAPAALAVADDAPRCGYRSTGSRVRWRAEAGQTYLVAVASASGRRGPARLQVEAVEPPAPRTRLTALVPRRTAQSTVSVAFDSDAPDATFECRIEGDTAWTACGSPVLRSGLAEGDYHVAVRAVAGGLADPDPAVAAFTVDRTAPAPSLTTPAAGAVVRQGEVRYDGACGTGSGDRPEVVVRIWAGETPTGTAQISPHQWCGPSFGGYAYLAEGRYTIVVEQQDDAGNTSATVPRQFTVHGDAPNVRLDTPASGTETSSRRPAFSGRVSGGGTVTVHVRASGVAAGDPDVVTLTATPTGSGSERPFTVTPATDLPEGRYDVQAEQTGLSGMTGTSGSRPFAVDATAPAVAVATPAEGAFARDWSIVVSGSGESGRSVVVSALGPGATTAQRTTTAQSGSWSVSFSGLAEGEHVITARQTDVAGNAGSSPPRTIHVDRTAPRPAILAPAEGADVPAGAVTVRGEAGGLGSDTHTVKLRLRTQDGADVLTRDVAVHDGSWSTEAELPAGFYVARVSQSDAAQNSGEAPARSFSISVPATGAPDPGPTPPPAPPPPPAPASPPAVRPPPPGPPAPARPPPARSPSLADVAVIADGLLPGRGTVELRGAGRLGNRLFVVPGASVRIRPSDMQPIGAAICPSFCTVRTRAAIRPDRRSGKAIRPRQLIALAGPAGRLLRIRVDAALRRTIQRAGGATATITFDLYDAAGARHRRVAKLRLLPRRSAA
jgi:hypothetical protein